MYLALGKFIGIVGASGLVITPIAWGGLFSPSRKVFMIGQSKSQKTKLFLEERKDKNSQTSNFDLKVMFNGKDILGKFFLCSPTQNHEDYYLLQLESGFWKKSLDGKITISNCDDKNIKNMGEKLLKLDIRPSGESGSSTALKEIDLASCIISDLRKEGSREGDAMFKLTCGELWATSTRSDKKVEIFTQTIENI